MLNKERKSRISSSFIYEISESLRYFQETYERYIPAYIPFLSAKIVLVALTAR